MESVWMCYVVPIGLGLGGLILTVAACFGLVMAIVWVCITISETAWYIAWHDKREAARYATRSAFNHFMRKLGKVLPWFLGGFVATLFIAGICYGMGMEIASWWFNCSNFTP